MLTPFLVAWHPVQSQTFSDVPPSHPYYPFIQKLANLGIVVGNPDGGFGPDAPALRYHGAVMIERALGNFIPPPSDVYHFDDVDDEDYFRLFVEDFAVRGITNGCGIRLFCPYSPMLKSQAAVFLVRATGNVNVTPTGTVFTDVQPETFAAGFIEKLFQMGATRGCNEVQYCPDASITRGEFSALLVRAFSL